MRMAAIIAGLLLSCAFAGAQPPAPGAKPPAAPPPLAAARPAIETLEFAIMRKGEQIGTHRIELLFVTAYRFQYTGTERWVNGRLVALSAETDDNGTQHKLTAALKGATLEVDADGKAAQVDKNIIPASLWNPELVRQSVMLDTQTGQVMPISVVDGGSEEVTMESGPAMAHRYTIKGKFSQDVWYDSRGRLVQSQLVGRDGSVISYKLM